LNRKKIFNFILDHIVEVLVIILVLFMWPMQANFMTVSNWLNILRNSSLKGVIAFGMAMVIISGQIDLSIGSIVALSGVMVAWSCRELPGLWGISVSAACILGIFFAIIIAILTGGIHAVSQHYFNMPPFIVTLVTLNVLYGIAGMLCGGFPIANTYPDWFNFLGTGKVGGPGGPPVPAVILVVLFLLYYFIMNYTTTGRSIYAVGGNAESARLSGINVFFTKFFAFTFTALMATIAGFMNSAQVRSGSYSFGRGWEVDVIAMAAIGGVSMTGGIGKAWGTFVGIVFLGVIINGMTMLNISIYAQYVIRGCLMFFAVCITTYQVKKRV
jgi:ribose/xylose/arabinose/galactoside ABC-type transport system permease subunit